LRINAGGTLIPAVTMSTAYAAVVVSVNASFKIWPTS
jgi:hypothetical protein